MMHSRLINMSSIQYNIHSYSLFLKFCEPKRLLIKIVRTLSIGKWSMHNLKTSILHVLLPSPLTLGHHNRWLFSWNDIVHLAYLWFGLECYFYFWLASLFKSLSSSSPIISCPRAWGSVKFDYISPIASTLLLLLLLYETSPLYCRAWRRWCPTMLCSPEPDFFFLLAMARLKCKWWKIVILIMHMFFQHATSSF
jgi:hypothetical protein